MTSVQAKILVVGGRSRIGAALRPLLPTATSYVVRDRSASSNQIIVEDYGRIPAAIFDGKSCVVNCVGVSRGSKADLQRINVDGPRQLAEAAKKSGVRHFIHISSFSVYGAVPVIDRRSLPSPQSGYGHSKLAGDAALLALADEDFAVTILRLPLVYGENSLGKLGQLIRFWERARVMPIPASDVMRSMIGVTMSAEVIALLIGKPHCGVILAADPRPFTYAETAIARGQLPFVRLPRPVTSFMQYVVPSIGNRLFASSFLVDADNFARQHGLESRLYDDIATASFV